LCCIRSPFPIGNVVFLVHIEAKLLCALFLVSLGLPIPPSRRTLLNLSNPPSVSSIVLIQSCALLYRCLRDSLKGASHGSSLTTPGKRVSYLPAARGGRGSLPVPSFGKPFEAPPFITELVESSLTPPSFTFSILVIVKSVLEFVASFAQPRC
jgi:hypothetical protein